MKKEDNADKIIRSLPCWSGDIQISSLSGGMTNLNFRVDDGKGSYVVRLGADVPEHLVCRQNEGVTSEAAAASGFSPKVIHRSPGILVIDFIVGKVFDADDVRDSINLARLIAILRQFHLELPQTFNGYPVLFWVFQVLRHYRTTLERANSRYLPRLPGLMSIAETLEQAVGSIELVFGHNDLLPANFIDDGEKIWLIDFDYAGFNSPLFDLSNLASNSDMDEKTERAMLESYFDERVDDQLWPRYNAMKCASLLRETMWSMVSEIFSQIDFDYESYTRINSERFDRAYYQYRENFA